MGIAYSHDCNKVQQHKHEMKIALPVYYRWETTRITEDTSSYQDGGALKAISLHLIMVNREQTKENGFRSTI